jgi:hypothetical protein
LNARTAAMREAASGLPVMGEPCAIHDGIKQLIDFVK